LEWPTDETNTAMLRKTGLSWWNI